MLLYENYTKRNQITKSLRLELRPQGKTLRNIKELNLLEQDKAIYALLERLKPVIDEGIKDIARDTLKNCELSFEKLYEHFLSGDKKAYAKESERLKKEIDKTLIKNLPEGIGKISEINSAKYLNGVLYDFIDKTHKDSEEKQNILSDILETKGYLALFSKFLTSRITTLEQSMPKRVIENFEIYAANIPKMQDALERGAVSFAIEYESICSVDYYNQILSQEDIDSYNRLISGIMDEDGAKEKGINQTISEKNIKIKSEHLEEKPFRILKQLHKQILEEREKAFTIDHIDSDEEVVQVTKEAFEQTKEQWENIKKINGFYAKDPGDITLFIVVGPNQTHVLSQLIYGEHDRIRLLLEEYEKNTLEVLPRRTKSEKARYDKFVNAVPKKVAKESHTFDGLQKMTGDDRLFILYRDELARNYMRIKEAYGTFERDILKSRRGIKGNRDVQESLVSFYDELTKFRSALRIINSGNDEKADPIFYNTFDGIFEKANRTYKAENLCRNYVTKSPADDARIMASCLGTPARLRTHWWNGEENFAINDVAMIRRGDEYYYFVLTPDVKPVDLKTKDETDAQIFVQRKGAKSFLGLPKALFKCILEPYFESPEHKNDKNCVIEEYVSKPLTIDRRAYDIFKNGTFKKTNIGIDGLTEEKFKDDCRYLIDVYKEFIAVYTRYSCFNMSGLKRADEYNDIGEFFSDVDTRLCTMEWIPVSFERINDMVDKKEGLLFLVRSMFLYNRPRKPYERTFIQLFSDSNMEHTSMLLNSRAMIQYRAASLPRRVTHKKGSILVALRDSNGEHIPMHIREAIYKMKNNFDISSEDFIMAKAYLAEHDVAIKKANEDIIRNRRYTEDKFFLSLSYTKNADISARTLDYINDKVEEDTQDSRMAVIVTRNLKDLTYVAVVDEKNNVLEEKSLNEIDGVNYRELLKERTKIKYHDKTRLWQYDVSSKGLKEAYVELAVTQISKLATKYNAVVVVESMSSTFKDKFSFLDEQIFKAFEARLCARMSDLSFNTIKEGEAGSISNPIQVSNNNGNSYQDGVIYFLNNAYTRTLCPDTGFVDVFDKTRLITMQSKRQFFAKMKDIRIDDGEMLFTFNLEEYPTKRLLDRKEWTVKIAGDGSYFDKDKGEYVYVNDIVREQIIPALLEDKAVFDGNMAEKFLDKTAISGKSVELIYKWFANALYGIITKKDGEKIYRSPITGTEIDVSKNTTYNFGKKFMFKQEYRGDGDFLDAFLNYMQAQDIAV